MCVLEKWSLAVSLCLQINPTLITASALLENREDMFHCMCHPTASVNSFAAEPLLSSKELPKCILLISIIKFVVNTTKMHINSKSFYIFANFVT